MRFARAYRNVRDHDMLQKYWRRLSQDVGHRVIKVSPFVFVVFTVFVVPSCRPMPPMGEDAKESRRPSRRTEFREVKYTDKTPEEWRELLGHPNPQVRDHAIDALVQYGPDQVPFLAKMVEDRSKPTARMAAIRALGAFGPRAAAAVPVIVAALQDQTWDGRDVAAESLGFIGQASPDVERALCEALKDGDERVRMAAARALGRCRAASQEAVKALAAALKDADPNVQMAAVEALGELGPAAQSAVPELEELARQGTPVLQATAQEALSRITGRKNAPP